MTTFAEPETEPQHDMAAYALAAAEADAIRTAAEAEAEAKRIKAAEEARRQAIANDRAELKLQQERARHEEVQAERARKRAAEEKARAAEAKAAAAEAEAGAAQEQRVGKSATRWRRTAMAFYVLCAAVALPLQISFFYTPERPYLALAPVLIEVSALVLLIGAAAAVTAGRAHWHYRLIAWGCAFVAAAINITHGLDAFDTATAIGTALASVAGPGVWDLHEHGRIARKEGRRTLRQRAADRRAAKRAAAEKAAAEVAAAAEKAARDAEVAARVEALAKQRAELYPEVWAHALRLAAALGQEAVTEEVWRQAHVNVEGAEPGEDAGTLRTRNAAARRVMAARSEAPGERPVKITNAQVVPQIPRGPRQGTGRGARGGPPVRGVRRKGDTAPYSTGARKAASETAKKAAS
ncbi:hypothetical protein [Streptomyces lonarensis]|uniref:SpdB2 protein n=1 Tax=Streptomyces lonarensis TaxID=700599 RepID=A0A7X6CX96_9ACTN|nr:hypothetical protein [Streptomyces lonarensis]NJQ04267.1 hypothetical protein [Streptomyces lonarensis]